LKTQIYSTGQLTPPFLIPVAIALVEFYLALYRSLFLSLSVS